MDQDRENDVIGQPHDKRELPFLVTHWLMNFSGSNDGSTDSSAQDRIRRLGNDLAAAFSELGAFGTSNQVIQENQSQPKLASYQDLQRRNARIAPNHLESLVNSSASVAAASTASLECDGSPNLIQAALEKGPDGNEGKRLASAIDLTRAQNDGVELRVVSSLHLAPLASLERQQSSSDDNDITKRIMKNPDECKQKEKRKVMEVSLGSDFSHTSKLSANAMKEFLDAREKYMANETEIGKLRRSKFLNMQRKSRKEQQNIPQPTQRGPQILDHTMEIEDEEQSTIRVLSQLEQSISGLRVSQNEASVACDETKIHSRRLYSHFCHMAQNHRDPFRSIRSHSIPLSFLTGHDSKNRLLSDCISRQVGASLCRGQVNRRPMGLPMSDLSAAETRKAILVSRFTHAATINAHLSFPVYCVQFDKTGQYFITGADDCLVKLFYIGAGKSNVTSRSEKLFSYGSNGRGAILVCTLRGHAGVICDLDISSDNAFVATASDDGDVRVWGMADGCPIAILRGHKHGANMVSWSTLTPYRLVTTGMDGLARLWDIRDAALKRYGDHVGKREEYLLELTDKEEKEIEQFAQSKHLENRDIPSRGGMGQGQDGTLTGDVIDPASGVALPQGNIPNANAEAQEDGAPNNANPRVEIREGMFVFNDIIDEGVKIISKMRHGDLQQDPIGPGTRARTKLVKVLCVARCPRGGHFATGSDDGLCRIWEDGDDMRVHMVDRRGNKDTRLRAQHGTWTYSPNTSFGKLLSTLEGHMTAITDLRYSNKGDRILTASQKDGNAQIWSWPTRVRGKGKGSQESAWRDPKQIILRLKNHTPVSASTAPRRRRGNSSSGSGPSVSCDVAVWSCDDASVITSQSCTKGTGEDIVPGSQLILFWDSLTGNCLLSINGAHTKQCSVIVPHPSEQTLMCSAGGDGVARLWDLTSGDCLLSFENLIQTGPLGPKKQRGDKAGFLDGTFDPSGLILILTDDNGRICIFYTLACDKDRSQTQLWMKEQYFANDYYELFYDTNGYCVERGSEKPPHLAPRSARCNHLGAAWADDVSRLFSELRGPPLLSASYMRKARDMMREEILVQVKYLIDLKREKRKVVVVAEFDPKRTVQICASKEVVQATAYTSVTSGESASGTNGEQPARNVSDRNLSSNFRWRDYDDMIRNENNDDDGDADDDEFVVDATRHDDQDEEMDGFVDENDLRTTLRTDGRRGAGSRDSERAERQRRREGNALRISTRQREQRDREDLKSESDSDDDVAEFMSTNNHPSGPFTHDYEDDGHLFRLPTKKSFAYREWLTRIENRQKSYRGLGNYAPQVGDTIVYIPSTHAKAIRAYPTLKTPWRQFPSGTQWPIVRCRILNIRYRFPLKEFYRKGRDRRCRSIFAILTLKVTGIPELSRERDLPWPKPVFIERKTTSHFFEVTIFKDSEHDEYILPVDLFLWRMRTLEEAIRQNPTGLHGLKVWAYFAPEDPEDDSIREHGGAKIMEVVPDTATGDHLSDSGTQSIAIRWNGHTDSEHLSPWELTPENEACSIPDVNELKADEKKLISRALMVVEGDSSFSAFHKPVDTSRYSDYNQRIEIPLDLSFVRKRLEADYYTSIQSVVCDIKVIRDNCGKYNGMNHSLHKDADRMYEVFLSKLNDLLIKNGLGDKAASKLNDEDFLHAAHNTAQISDKSQETGGTVDNDNETSHSRTSEDEDETQVDTLNLKSEDPPHLETELSIEEDEEVFSSSDEAEEDEAEEEEASYDEPDEESDDDEGYAAKPAPVHATRQRATTSRSTKTKTTNIRRSKRRSGDHSESSENERHDPSVQRTVTRSSLKVAQHQTNEERGSRNMTRKTLRKAPSSQATESARRSTRSTRSKDKSVLERVSDFVKQEIAPTQRSSGRARTQVPSYHDPSSEQDVDEADSSDCDSEPQLMDKRPLRSRSQSAKKPRPTRSKKRPASCLAKGNVDSSELECAEPQKKRIRIRIKPETAVMEYGDRRSTRNRKSVAPTNKGPPRSTRSRRASKRNSVFDSDTSDIEDHSGHDQLEGADSSFEESEEDAEEEGKRSTSARSRHRATKGKKIQPKDPLPAHEDWPNITRRKSEVIKGILFEVRILDVDDSFSAPVIEKFAKLKTAYLRKIRQPMDLRTIEEKADKYISMRDFQNDLELIFRNCVAFNGEESDHGKHAINIWEQLSAIFIKVCDAQNVRITKQVRDQLGVK